MRVCFCGSSDFAVPTLEALIDSAHELVGVITQPARPAGRGGKLRPTDVAVAAREAGLHPLECPDINDPQFVVTLRGLAPDVICVIDFGQLIRRPARECARVDTINVHGSILPELRGAAPINWAIIRGYRRTGLTTFSLVDEMDAGPVYLTTETDVSPDETAAGLRTRLAGMAPRIALETIGLLTSGWAEPRPQDHSRATLAPRLSKADGRLDFADDAESLRNRIHGTWPWPGAGAVFRGRKDSRVILARVQAEDSAGAGEGGEVDDDLCVTTGRGRLRIVELKPAGKRLMTWKDFVNGHRVTAGDRFESVE